MKVSLQDFGFHQPNAQEINTPRSLEACRREGIQPNEIVKIPFEEFCRRYKTQNLDHKGIEQFYKHYEERREEKFRQLIKQRHIVQDDEKTGVWTNDVQKNKLVSKYQESSSLVEKEKAQLDKIRKKQQKEITNMLEYELKMQEIKNENDKKLEEEHMKQLAKDLEIQKKRQEQEEIRQQKELEKQKRREQEEELQRKKLEELNQKEIERKKLEEIKQKEREEEAKRKDIERKNIQERLKKQNEDSLKQQQIEFEKKKVEMEQKDEQRKKQLEEQRQAKKHEAEESRKANQERILQAKQRNEQEQEKLKSDFDRKLKISELKVKQYEEEKKKKLEQQRQEAEHHAELFKKVIEQNTMMEEQKKNAYLKKIKEVEDRKKIQDEEIQKEKEIKKQLEKEKEDQRKQVLIQNEENNKCKVEGLLKKINDKEEALQKIQDERQESLKDKMTCDLMKRFDKKDNVERIMRKKEYDRRKLQERLSEKMERANKIQSDLSALLSQRQDLRREIEQQKRDIMVKFQKVREGKLSSNEISKQLGLQEIDKFHTQQNPYRTFSSTRPQSNQAKVKVEYFQSIKQAKKIQSAKPDTKQSKESLIENKSVYPQIETKIIPQTTPNKFHRKIDAKKQETKRIEPPSQEIIITLNKMVQKHNQDMMRLLMEEHAQENLRDEKISQLKGEEKAKLEKEYALERAKAQLKIEKLKQNQDHEQQQYKLINNVREDDVIK